VRSILHLLKDWNKEEIGRAQTIYHCMLRTTTFSCRTTPEWRRFHVAGELSAHAHKHTSSDEELAHELAVSGAAVGNFSVTTDVELYGFWTPRLSKLCNYSCLLLLD
jgi:hypothetical protein